jgi:WD40 repeat protein
MIAGNRWLLAVVVVPLFAVLEIAPAPAMAQELTAEKKPLLQVEKDGYWRERLAFTPDGRRLACNPVLIDFTGKELAKGDVEGLPPCMYVAFSPDGKRLASVHFDDGASEARHAVCLWSVANDNKLSKIATLQPKKDQRTAHRQSMYFLTFSQDSSLLATREQDDSTAVWDTTTGKERLRLDTQGLAVGFAPDGKTLAAVTRDGLVQHWDLATKKCVAAPADAKREDYLFVRNAIASADGKTLALTDDYSVILKDAQSGKTLRRFDNRFMRDLTLSADGKTFAVTTEDRVVLFARDTGKELAQLKTGDASVEALALSPDGKALAVAINDDRGRRYSVAVWETAKLPTARKDEVKRTPPPMPLEARLTSKKEVYPLSLGGKTPEDFAKQIGRSDLPPAPKIDLVLTLRNTGTKPLTIAADASISLYLTGDGAMNHPGEIYQTEGRTDGEKRKTVTLAPGKTHEIPIKSLDRGDSERSYWLLPGEYTLHAGCFLYVDPVPEGGERGPDTSGFVTLNAPPLRVKVDAAKK